MRLDKSSILTKYKHVKRPITSILILSLLVLIQTSCKPAGIDPEALSQLLEQNIQMREYLKTMESRILQGESMQLTSPLELRKFEVALAKDIEEITQLDKRAAQAKIRLLELQNRHASFLEKFRSLQQEIVLGQQ